MFQELCFHAIGFRPLPQFAPNGANKQRVQQRAPGCWWTELHVNGGGLRVLMFPVSRDFTRRSSGGNASASREPLRDAAEAPQIRNASTAVCSLSEPSANARAHLSVQFIEATQLNWCTVYACQVRSFAFIGSERLSRSMKCACHVRFELNAWLNYSIWLVLPYLCMDTLALTRSETLDNPLIIHLTQHFPDASR